MGNEPKARPEPDFSLQELEAIARAEARRSAGLTPYGGRRWTAEDIAFAVSVLFVELGSKSFQTAWAAGVTKTKARRWLAKALHNRLLNRARRLHRMKLLDEFALDALPTSRRDMGALASQDRTVLVARIMDQLTVAGRLVAAEVLHIDGTATRRRQTAAPRNRVAPRTLERERSRVRGILGSVVKRAGLSRDEALDMLQALAVKLAGRGDP